MKIPSDIIEPHIVNYFTGIIEDVAFGMKTPQQARDYLNAVERFVCQSSEIHAQYATINVFHKMTSLSDEEMIAVCTETVNTTKRFN